MTTWTRREALGLLAAGAWAPLHASCTSGSPAPDNSPAAGGERVGRRDEAGPSAFGDLGAVQNLKSIPNLANAGTAAFPSPAAETGWEIGSCQLVVPVVGSLATEKQDVLGIRKRESSYSLDQLVERRDRNGRACRTCETAPPQHLVPDGHVTSRPPRDSSGWPSRPWHQHRRQHRRGRPPPSSRPCRARPRYRRRRSQSPTSSRSRPDTS